MDRSGILELMPARYVGLRLASFVQTRRDMLHRLGIMGGALGASQWLTSFPIAAAVPRASSMREWMDSWTGVKARDPVGGLYVYRFKEPMWALTEPIAWRPDSEASNPLQRVDVPSGFVTDFASIPRAFYSLLRPDGEYAYAAVVHDYLYWVQNRPRDVCDDVFKACMRDFQVSEATIDVIYRAVRLFGGSAWRENRRLRMLGEKRILIRLPSDPRITWADWKKDPSVFIR